uniref:Uncharacterized protein n=1 Tax=Aegilops tauschii subsp. strangulata TaxID=200361 RepID=A0A453AP87_AEGTS
MHTTIAGGNHWLQKTKDSGSNSRWGLTIASFCLVIISRMNKRSANRRAFALHLFIDLVCLAHKWKLIPR